MRLKFLFRNMANTLISFAEKNVSALQKLLTFCSKHINIFENILVSTVNKFVINELVKINWAKVWINYYHIYPKYLDRQT